LLGTTITKKILSDIKYAEQLVAQLSFFSIIFAVGYIISLDAHALE